MRLPPRSRRAARFVEPRRARDAELEELALVGELVQVALDLVDLGQLALEHAQLLLGLAQLDVDVAHLGCRVRVSGEGCGDGLG